MTDKAKPGSQVEGEGSDNGTKTYNGSTGIVLGKGKVDEAAQQARQALRSDAEKG